MICNIFNLLINNKRIYILFDINMVKIDYIKKIISKIYWLYNIVNIKLNMLNIYFINKQCNNSIFFIIVYNSTDISSLLKIVQDVYSILIIKNIIFVCIIYNQILDYQQKKLNKFNVLQDCILNKNVSIKWFLQYLFFFKYKISKASICFFLTSFNIKLIIHDVVMVINNKSHYKLNNILLNIDLKKYLILNIKYITTFKKNLFLYKYFKETNQIFLVKKKFILNSNINKNLILIYMHNVEINIKTNNIFDFWFNILNIIIYTHLNKGRNVK